MGLSVIIPNFNEPKVEEVEKSIKVLFPEAQVIIGNDWYGVGKGAIIRSMLYYVENDLVCFIDGDMDISPLEIHRLLEKEKDYDIVVATKNWRYLTIRRKILSVGYKCLVYILFGLKIDTQTGLKLFHRYAIPDWKTDGFAFDVEVLYKAKQNGYTIGQVPITCVIHKQKGLIPIWRTLIETIKIWLRL